MSFRLLLVSCFVGALVALSPGCRETGHPHAEAAAHGDLAVGNPYPGHCPVMGNEVDMDKAREAPELHADYNGKRYFFCCKMCKPKFEKDPEKYLATPVKPRGEAHSDDHGSH